MVLENVFGILLSRLKVLLNTMEQKKVCCATQDAENTSYYVRQMKTAAIPQEWQSNKDLLNDNFTHVA